MFERLLPSALCRKFMSELGIELEEALATGDWLVNEFTLTHKASKIELWIGSGYPFFRLYRAPNVNEEVLKTMLNRFDLCVIWRAYRVAIKKHNRKKKDAKLNEVLNTLRLGRIKESGEKI